MYQSAVLSFCYYGEQKWTPIFGQPLKCNLLL